MALVFLGSFLRSSTLSEFLSINGNPFRKFRRQKALIRHEWYLRMLNNSNIPNRNNAAISLTLCMKFFTPCNQGIVSRCNVCLCLICYEINLKYNRTSPCLIIGSLITCYSHLLTYDCLVIRI